MKSILLLILVCILALVLDQAREFNLTAEQFYPIMGYAGTALPVLGVVAAFFIGRLWDQF